MEIFGIPIQAFLGQLLLGLVNGSFYAMLSLGLAVIFGLLGIVNFAHGALYMMGAYVAFVSLDSFGIGYWGALVIAPPQGAAPWRWQPGPVVREALPSALTPSTILQTASRSLSLGERRTSERLPSSCVNRTSSACWGRP